MVVELVEIALQFADEPAPWGKSGESLERRFSSDFRGGNRLFWGFGVDGLNKWGRFATIFVTTVF